eukprot:4344030-Pyramimonas_sp.AAC.1
MLGVANNGHSAQAISQRPDLIAVYRRCRLDRRGRRLGGSQRLLENWPPRNHEDWREHHLVTIK